MSPCLLTSLPNQVKLASNKLPAVLRIGNPPPTAVTLFSNWLWNRPVVLIDDANTADGSSPVQSANVPLLYAPRSISAPTLLLLTYPDLLEPLMWFAKNPGMKFHPSGLPNSHALLTVGRSQSILKIVTLNPGPRIM